MKQKTLIAISLAALVGAARAETLILKDGTFIEGKIVSQSGSFVRLETRFGTRTFNQKDIEQIVKTPDEGDPDSAKKFAELPEAVRAVLNAEADYKLGNYQKALSRLEKFKDYNESPAVRIRIDWLFIEINERMAKWETVKDLLKKKKESGTPREKLRAQAHLDIFEVNPNYELSFVGKENARNFLVSDDLRTLARERDALKDARLMSEALKEYCEQTLTEDKLGVKAFSDKLRPRETYEAVKKLPKSGDIDKHLPYNTDLTKIQQSIYKAQAVLGDYGHAYETDLIRAELVHLFPIFAQLFEELIMASPENFVPPFDPMTGRLTGQGRQQWQQRCDQFLEQAVPVSRLIDYMVDKSNLYPNTLRDLRTLCTDLKERLDQMISGVKKARRRTDA